MTNLLHFNKSITNLNKYMNLDMENLSDCLNAGKISQDVQKTINIKFSTKRLYPTNSVK